MRDWFLRRVQGWGSYWTWRHDPRPWTLLLFVLEFWLWFIFFPVFFSLALFMVLALPWVVYDEGFHGWAYFLFGLLYGCVLPTPLVWWLFKRRPGDPATLQEQFMDRLDEDDSSNN